MKLLDKFTKQIKDNASEAVKDEVKKTAISIVPGLLSVATAVIGVIIFRNNVSDDSSYEKSPEQKTKITNNYYFMNMSESSVREIVEDK